MPVLLKLRRLFAHYLGNLTGQNLAIMLACYIAVAWAGMRLAGEEKLTDITSFFYWLSVTASTVGYGDLSPSTATGRWFAALFIIPVGLSLFALTIGRAAAWASFNWRKGVRGLRDLSSLRGHILVIGWNGPRTLHLAKLLLKEESMNGHQRAILLCAKDQDENPMPDAIHFVKVESYNDDEGLTRAGIEGASCIIVDTPEDDVTMTSALYCANRNQNAHILAYFEDEKLGRLLRQHCPKVECTPSVAVEMLAKAAADPGSSALHHDLLSVAEGVAQFSVGYPASARPIKLEALFRAFKERHQATLIGVTNPGQGMCINPPLDSLVNPGAKLWYIADRRVRITDWEHL